MNLGVVKSLLGLLPTGMVALGSATLFLKGKTFGSFLQLVGAVCLVIVVLTHFCEGLHLFCWMGWGDEHTIGHYLNLVSAVLGLTLFPFGYLLYVLTNRSESPVRAEDAL
jgi:succinate dehydrogenase/fumarate reductase cytochrome b subunit